MGSQVLNYKREAGWSLELSNARRNIFPPAKPPDSATNWEPIKCSNVRDYGGDSSCKLTQVLDVFFSMRKLGRRGKKDLKDRNY